MLVSYGFYLYTYQCGSGCRKKVCINQAEKFCLRLSKQIIFVQHEVYHICCNDFTEWGGRTLSPSGIWTISLGNLAFDRCAGVCFPCGLWIWKKIRSNQTNLCFLERANFSHSFYIAIFISSEKFPYLCFCLKRQIYNNSFYPYSMQLLYKKQKHKLCNELNVCVPLKFICWSPNSHVMCLDVGSLGFN
jgi:hypothetical protein